jgi:hypothetical protein
VARPAVRGVPFEVVPARLDRLKVGGVGRARFEMAAGVGLLDRRDRSSLVHRPVSPEEDDVAAHVAPQPRPKGRHDFPPSSVYPYGLSSHVRSKPIFRPRSYNIPLHRDLRGLNEGQYRGGDLHHVVQDVGLDLLAQPAAFLRRRRRSHCRRGISPLPAAETRRPCRCPASPKTRPAWARSSAARQWSPTC